METENTTTDARVTDGDLIADPEIAHKGDFLTNPTCHLRRGTTFYLNASTVERAECRAGIIRRGYTHEYLSLTSHIANHFDHAADVRTKLKELVDDGIKPVVWLTSDTGAWKNKSISSINAELSEFIPKIDDLVSSYCLGIEIDEYWSHAEARVIGLHLDTLTNKAISVHQLSGRYDYCLDEDWCDYMIFQYGSGKSADTIAIMTLDIVAKLNKPVVAGEYSTIGMPESDTILLGDTAMASGAVGFGNGGTP